MMYSLNSQLQKTLRRGFVSSVMCDKLRNYNIKNRRIKVNYANKKSRCFSRYVNTTNGEEDNGCKLLIHKTFFLKTVGGVCGEQ